MSCTTGFFSGILRSACLRAVLAVSAAALAADASAAPTVLAQNNSSVTLDFNGGGGLSSWLVDSVQQANQQWFWYRIGNSGPQYDLTQISSPIITPVGTHQVTAVYSNAQLTVRLSYTLSGSGAGTGKSSLNETVSLYNNTASPLDLHFFMYSDFVLGGAGQAGSQNVTLGNVNGTSTSVQTFGQPGANTVAVISPATHEEAALYNTTYTELTTTSGLTLDDSATAGPGNVTWAWEWDYSLAANGSKQISILDNLVVPEPGCATLGLAAAGLMALRRMWRKK